MLEHIRLLILDLDHVVFDGAPLKLAALRQSLIAFADNLPQSVRLPDAVDAEEGYREHGFRWTQFLEIGLGEEQSSEFQLVYRLQEQHLLESGAGGFYPGVLDLIGLLRRAGIELALGADATRDYLMAVSDRHQLDRLFDLSLCTEEFGVGSAAEMYGEIMHHHEVNPSETVVLGTRPAMFEAAHGLDLFTIGCGWGIRQHERLAEADLTALTLARLEPALLRADELSTHWGPA